MPKRAGLPFYPSAVLAFLLFGVCAGCHSEQAAVERASVSENDMLKKQADATKNLTPEQARHVPPYMRKAMQGQSPAQGR